MNKRKQALPWSHWSITVRNLVIARLQECAHKGISFNSDGEEYDATKLDQMSNEDLLALLEDVIGFNG